MIPRNKTTSMVLIKTLVAINSAALLKVSPPSFTKMRALMVQCTSKKDIKNNPVMPMANFLPMDE
jgi:hypothetical protein